MIHMRPVSPGLPLEVATRLPDLRTLDCPYLWEHLPAPFTSRALRQTARVWEGLGAMPAWSSVGPPCGEDADQAAPMPDLVCAMQWHEFGGGDPLSLGLRDLATCLEELDVRALITHA
ncbi:hypothetical protein F5144DRAFT_629121 [Chaetomium tenue]|uniref:Uncharacterized protein n=1 Tax=Chaetomium tenue TaxID=1854479 RepID=A0ACB7PDC0_9PEZI|nr:hypothetical protein F5144DRAFT_629121 [Chaetomium globosum]